MTMSEMARLIDQLDAGPAPEQIMAANIRAAGQRGYAFVMSTTERQRDCWFPCSFHSRRHQERAASASVLAACELQLIVEMFTPPPRREGRNAYA